MADEGIALREIAAPIGRRLNVPVVSKTTEEANVHFGSFAHFVAADIPGSGQWTRENLSWQPKQAGLILISTGRATLKSSKGETMADTSDRTAIITGGSRGLGRNTTVNLARRGVDIVFTYHSNAAEAQNLVREVEPMSRKAAAFQLDTSNVKAFDTFVQKVDRTLRGWGRERFDYLVNNAGTSLHKPFEQTTEAEFDQIVNVHFKGVYFLTQKLLPLMNDRGRIVNISCRPGALPHSGHLRV